MYVAHSGSDDLTLGHKTVSQYLGTKALLELVNPQEQKAQMAFLWYDDCDDGCGKVQD